ncbi:class I SAM-dependent methyltransferase [Ferrimonas gelatinilytica]|uniref:Ribosomal RNA small subunit methyltransferase C n=1 Tax=Ferrimonas gelatinilytica TaxID=1255257 RepID=A0ABP9SEL0_9GAMM
MALTNPSRLVAKNLDLFAGQSLLILNPDSDELPTLIAKQDCRVTLLSSDLLTYEALDSLLPSQIHRHFGADLEALSLPPFDAALIRLPKSKAELLYLTAMAASQLPPEAPIYWVGDNKGGIRSAGKALARWVTPPNKVASGAHCQLLQGHNLETQPWETNPWWLHHDVTTPDGTLPLASLPGVFGHGTLDQGTRLLLAHLPQLPQGRVLDFGCGDGIIGAFLARRNPKIDLTLVDVSALALKAAEESLRLNGCRGRVLASNGLAKVTGKFDLIVSNPPFHQGRDQSFDVARRFIQDAANALAPGGQLIIVANQHLPYGEDLDRAFGRVNIIGQDNKFKIYADKK